MNPLHQFFRELHIAIIKTHNNGFIIKRLTPYLKNGRYKNSISYDCIYKRDLPAVISGKTFSSKLSMPLAAKYIIRCFNEIIQYSVKGKIEDKLFLGTEVILSSSLTESKIFDYTNGRVLTLYDSQLKMRQVNENKLLFSFSYNVPSTIYINEKENYTIESFIRHVKYDVETAFESLIDSFYKHLSSSIQRHNSIDELYHSKCIFFANRFGDSPLLNDSIGAIMCSTHGDLWSSNVIFDGHKYYITDFERAGDRFCLFDFFYFIFSEWQINHNSQLLDLYFEGRYDKILINIFSVIQMTYEVNKRAQYFISFLVSVTYERWQRKSKIDVDIMNCLKLYIPSYSNNVSKKTNNSHFGG